MNTSSCKECGYSASWCRCSVLFELYGAARCEGCRKPYDLPLSIKPEEYTISDPPDLEREFPRIMRYPCRDCSPRYKKKRQEMVELLMKWEFAYRLQWGWPAHEDLEE